MVWIPGGTFWMGADDTSMADAKPVHEVTVSGFWMDRTEVTNRQFARFVKRDRLHHDGRATARSQGVSRCASGKARARLDRLHAAGGTGFSRRSPGLVALRPGANWRHPEGPGSSIEGKDDHPVVQICWYDAVAFANGPASGCRPKPNGKWRRAADDSASRYVWGNESRPGGKWQANIWEGHFPDQNSSDDGFARTAPVATFPPNGFGLHDIAGNVWEWCSDWYRPDYDNWAQRDPTGPPSSYDPS